MKAFLRLASGTILVSADDSSIAGLYRSRDGGATFDALPAPPHVRALSERDGKVYAATDNFSEGYAAAVSGDEGSSWTPLLAYQDVRAVMGCLKASCQEICASEVQLSLWPEDVCSADAPAGAPDAGDALPEPPPANGTGGSGGADGGAADRGAANSGGCHCGTAPANGKAGGLAVAAAMACLIRRRRQRAPRA
jgi:hypothetical protein